ncbi:hypothetical protein BSR29_01460 [Boudabousia liubingyangii]|uniref:GST C-terminal domain-containing protein n=1 Tax=Boudabousia liubingyangii TaxID=1921764 RepID=A0A1Q5PPX6_9ACTO|nr:hypothetical protein [Boudabousia liubingyangii]OKL49651.1 hypothetical protein BSR29_01460 [Boudabousia liubingyangii]
MPVPHLRFAPSSETTPQTGEPQAEGVQHDDIFLAAHEGAEPTLPVQAGRYRLVTYVGCPWCRRAEIARRLLGLTEALELSRAYKGSDDGFCFETHDQAFDQDLRVRTTRELYRRQPGWEPGESTSVPVIVDQQGHFRGQIVSRQSGDILEDLANAWKELHAADAPDLYPQDPEVRAEIDKFDEWVDENLYHPNGTMLHSDDQEEITAAQTKVVTALNQLEGRLVANGWMIDSQVRGSDVRVFAILVSLAASRAKQIFKAARDSALEKGLNSEDAARAGSLAVRESGSAFADWPHLDGYFKRLLDNPVWLSAEERSALHL